MEPNSAQPGMKAALREIDPAPTRAEAEIAVDLFAAAYQARCPKAVECVRKGQQAPLASYDWPTEHLVHLMTVNPIQDVFATVRHQIVRTKGALSPTTVRLMFKLVMAAAKSWRRLMGENQLPKVIAGVRFKDGAEVILMPKHNVA
jgi:transposase-like protein